MGVPRDAARHRPARAGGVPPLTGLVSATAAVPDVDTAAHALIGLLGYELRSRGPIRAEHEARWGVAAGSAGDEWVLLAAPGSSAGMLRLVRGEPRAAGDRLPARWAGVELVVRDVDALTADADAAAGFEVLHAPVTVDLSRAGSLVHRSAVVVGPGGMQLMFTQALSQPRDRTFHRADGAVGPVFAAHLRVADKPAALRLYRDTLGMRTLLALTLDHGWWHEFWRLPVGERVEVDVLSGSGHGTVEVQAYAPHLLDATPPPADRQEGGIALVELAAAGTGPARGLVGPAGERLELV